MSSLLLFISVLYDFNNYKHLLLSQHVLLYGLFNVISIFCVHVSIILNVSDSFS